MPGWNWQKIKQTLSNTLRLNFSYLKIIRILHPHYHPKIIGHILKNKEKNKFVCIHEIMRLIITEIKVKMKNRLHRYVINRSRSRHGHKYGTYKKCFAMTMVIGIKQHLSNTWNSIHEKAEAELKKKRCLYKKDRVIKHFGPCPIGDHSVITFA